MKKNALNLLLLSSLVGTLVTGCDKPVDSGQESPSESQSVSESESQQGEAKIKVNLTRKIYLRSEINERIANNDIVLDYDSVELYSAALEGYKPYEGVPKIAVPEGNGPVKATVTIAKYKITLDIEVYDTAELAAQAHPVSQEQAEASSFELGDYLDTSKTGKYKLYNDVIYDEATKKFVVNPADSKGVGYQSWTASFVNNAKRLTSEIFTWCTSYSFLYTSDADNPCVSTLDPNRKTVPHRAAVNESGVQKMHYEALGENTNYLYQVADEIVYSSTACYERNDDLLAPGQTYGNISNDVIQSSNPGSMFESEIIFDANGRICYCGVVHGAGGYTNIALTDYDSYYVDPIYQSNDYATVEGALANTNPAFVFAPDYDPNDPEKMYHFEKVVPEGGYYIVGSNSNQSTKTVVDNVWGLVSGLNKSVASSSSEMNRSNEENLGTLLGIGHNAENYIVRYKNESTASTINKLKKYTNAVVVYSDATSFDVFALLYKLAYDSKDQTLLAKGDDVIASLKYQAVDFVKAEPVLLQYYADKTQEIMNDWQETFFPGSTSKSE